MENEAGPIKWTDFCLRSTVIQKCRRQDKITVDAGLLEAATVNLEIPVIECQCRILNTTQFLCRRRNHLRWSQVGPGSSETKTAEIRWFSIFKREDLEESCWQCGAMHSVKNSKFSSHQCKQFNKTGHKEGYCGCFSKISTSEPTSGSSPNANR